MLNHNKGFTVCLLVSILLIASCSLFDSGSKKTRGTQGLLGQDGTTVVGNNNNTDPGSGTASCINNTWYNAGSCVPCPTDSTADASGTACICLLGTFNPSNNSCGDCDADQRRTVVSGNIMCVDCPANSTASTDHNTCVCSNGYGTYSPQQNECIIPTSPDLLRLYVDNAPTATQLDFGNSCSTDAPASHILKIDKTTNVNPVNLVYLSLAGSGNNNIYTSDGFAIRTTNGQIPYNVNIDTNYSLPIYSSPVPLMGMSSMQYRVSFVPPAGAAEGTVYTKTVTAKVNSPSAPGDYITKTFTLRSTVHCPEVSYKFTLDTTSGTNIGTYNYAALQTDPTADLLRISAGVTKDLTLTILNTGAKQIKVRSFALCTGTTTCTNTSNNNFVITEGVQNTSTGDPIEIGDSGYYTLSFTSPSPAVATDTVFNSTLLYKVEYLNSSNVLTTDTRRLHLTATRPQMGVAYKLYITDPYSNPQEKTVFDTATPTATPSFDCGTFINGQCNYNASGGKAVTLKIENLGSDPLNISAIGLTNTSSSNFYSGCSGYNSPISQNNAWSCSILCKCPTTNTVATNNGVLQVTLNSSLTHNVALTSKFVPASGYSVTIGGAAPPYVFNLSGAAEGGTATAQFKIDNFGGTPVTLQSLPPFGFTESGGKYELSNCSATAPATIAAGTAFTCTITAKKPAGLHTSSWNINPTINGTANTFKIAAYYLVPCTGSQWSYTGFQPCQTCSTGTPDATVDYYTGMTLHQNCPNPGSGTGGCFKKGTKIATTKGDVNIEEIKVGDILYSYDLVNKSIVENKVVELLVHKNFKDPATLVTLEDGTKIYSTKKHPFFSPAKKHFLHLKKFKVGDKVLVYKDKAFKEMKIKSFEDQPFFDVEYNIHLEKDPHNYIANGAIVHNAQDTGSGTGTGTGGGDDGK